MLCEECAWERLVVRIEGYGQLSESRDGLDEALSECNDVRGSATCATCIALGSGLLFTFLVFLKSQ